MSPQPGRFSPPVAPRRAVYSSRPVPPTAAYVACGACLAALALLLTLALAFGRG